MNIATAAVVRLQAEGWPEPIYAHRRWGDPAAGSAVVVVTMADEWASMRTTAQAPTVRIMVYAAPSDQASAEEIALEMGDRVRSILHRPQGGAPTWSGLRVLFSLHAGGSLAEVEGHPDWRVRSLVFEVETA